MNKVPMTERGAEKLREELQRLKTVERPRIVQAIAEARAHGDLKENAEYHAAREQQSFAEGRIKEIEGKLVHAQIMDVCTAGCRWQGRVRCYRRSDGRGQRGSGDSTRSLARMRPISRRD